MTSREIKDRFKRKPIDGPATVTELPLYQPKESKKCVCVCVCLSVYVCVC